MFETGQYLAAVQQKNDKNINRKTINHLVGKGWRKYEIHIQQVS